MAGKTAKKSTGKKNKPDLSKLDETGIRKVSDRRQNDVSVANDGRKAHRRRQIDPTTCEREYTDQEIEFMQAMDEYKRLSGRMFPTCSEILEVMTNLGYRQIADQQEIYNPNSTDNNSEPDVEIEDNLV